LSNQEEKFPEKPNNWPSDDFAKARYEALLRNISGELESARAERCAVEALGHAKLQKKYEQKLAEAAAEQSLRRAKEQKKYEQELGESTAEEAFRRLRIQKGFEQDLASSFAYYAAIADLAKSGVDRSRSGSERVQTAAAAIATIYTGVLGLVFAVDKNRLPLAGLVPTIFLGIAITCSTAYASYLTPTSSLELSPAPASVTSAMEKRAVELVKAANLISYNRVYWVRCSVISLGVAVLYLPAAFLDISRGVVSFLILLGAGGLVTFVLPRLVRGPPER
jgi:hypothetical protein